MNFTLTNLLPGKTGNQITKNSYAPAKTPEQQPKEQSKVSSSPSLPSPSVSEIKPTPIPDDVIKLKPAPDKSKLPIAKKADGKPGYLVSPYVPGKLIDAIDVPSGTEVGDPYALGKLFSALIFCFCR